MNRAEVCATEHSFLFFFFFKYKKCSTENSQTVLAQNLQYILTVYLILQKICLIPEVCFSLRKHVRQDKHPLIAFSSFILLYVPSISLYHEFIHLSIV